MSDKFIPHLWKILFAGAIAVILLIVCTDWRIGNYENAEEYNSLWIALAVGVLASCIFYWINEIIPRRELHKTMKNPFLEGNGAWRTVGAPYPLDTCKAVVYRRALWDKALLLSGIA